MIELKTDTQRPAPRLSDLDEPERIRLFSQLQERMLAVWDAWRLGLEDESVVVVPSVTLDPAAPGEACRRRSRSGCCSCSCYCVNRGCA